MILFAWFPNNVEIRVVAPFKGAVLCNKKYDGKFCRKYLRSKKSVLSDLRTVNELS